MLTTGEAGMGYKGCQIFQCWEGESVITGDFELNNGRGGRSIFEEPYFLPDDTKLMAVRGTVGMRRTQKRHDNLGMVGSQFRIILQEMRGFTGKLIVTIDWDTSTCVLCCRDLWPRCRRFGTGGKDQHVRRHGWQTDEEHRHRKMRQVVDSIVFIFVLTDVYRKSTCRSLPTFRNICVTIATRFIVTIDPGGKSGVRFSFLLATRRIFHENI